MHELYELKEKLMKELGEYSQNGKFSKEDAEVIKYLASSIDHICNIVIDMEEEEGYSMAGSRYSREGGQGGGRYSREGRGGMRYSRENRQGGGQGGNSYARGRNQRRDSRGRYSSEYRDGAPVDELVESLGEVMGDLPQELQMDAQKLMRKLEQMM